MTPNQFLTSLKNLKAEDLNYIKGIGPILAQNITEFTESSRFNKIQAKFSNLESENIEIEILQSAKVNKNLEEGKLENETICITGSFEKSRDELKEILESYGASVTDAVTRKTTILLVGDKAGSKLKKAEELGIRIVNSIDEIL